MPLDLQSIEHTGLKEWITSIISLTNPAKVHFCDGSRQEADTLFAELVQQGRAIKLTARENCYYFRSDPRDVARVESKTYICCKDPEFAGPLNNWMDPKKMRLHITGIFTNAFEGRTMYIMPFSMGPIGGNISKIGVQITDSAYAVLNTRIMTRMDVPKVLAVLGTDNFFVPCLHASTNDRTVGETSRWPCDPQNMFVSHFTDGPAYEIVAYGSGYGGNSLLCKKALALRISSVMSRGEQSLAEHMLIMGVTSKKTRKTTYLTCALPSACGKTNLAMLQSVHPDIEITTLGDDIAWLKVNQEDGRLYGVNAEAGFFGVAPGTNFKTNAVAMEIIQKDTIFTNVALLPDKSDIWFEGMESDNNGEYPAELIDWLGEKWTPGCGRVSSHPNSRFTSPLTNCPILDPHWDEANGVPISAILYGGRNASLPLVTQAFNVQHGVYQGLCCSSESTAAQEGSVGVIRNDPFALRPFLAYHIGDYVKHLLRVLNNLKHKPLIFNVNWFRRDPKTQQFMWKGYSKNSLVLKWIVDRVQGTAGARETAIGLVPNYTDFDFSAANYEYTEQQWDALFAVDAASIKSSTLVNQEQLFLLIGSNLPIDMIAERWLFANRL